ncbi:MAG TPA: helix-turn-helix domain-containing protein, partial [Candidatus Binataceae bacterium]|nr:helix-turn-helix domain-containing protein [Candidatus Binataceae bacterium]
DHILRAAAEVFAQKSFGLASIRDIAAHAQISFPRIYYYLRNKEELLFLISRRAFEKLSARAEEQTADAHDRKKSCGALSRCISNISSTTSPK